MFVDLKTDDSKVRNLKTHIDVAFPDKKPLLSRTVGYVYLCIISLIQYLVKLIYLTSPILIA